MESIKALRAICQAGKVEKKRGRYWWYIWFGRKPSIYITRILLPLPISPNVISLISIALGVFGAYCIAQPDIDKNIVGTILVYLYWLLDKVDGEIARYKKLQSLKGKYLDEVAHFFLPGLFFFGITIRALALYPAVGTVVIGIVAILCVTGIRFSNFFPSLLIGKKALKYQDIYLKNTAAVPPTESSQQKPNTSMLQHVARCYHQFQTLFMINAVLLIILLLIKTTYLTPDAGIAVFLVGYALYLALNLFEEIIKKYIRLEQETKRELEKILQ